MNYYSIKIQETRKEDKERSQGILKKLLIKDFKYKRNKILHFFLDKIDRFYYKLRYNMHIKINIYFIKLETNN